MPIRKLGLLLLASLAALVVACGIPDDGKSDVVGRVAIDPALLATVVMPGDPAADADCAGAVAWGDDPIIGDVAPTLYVGLYGAPIDPADVDSWFATCGEVDDDNNPATPGELHTEGCPVAGTTGVYHAPTADEPWTFEFTVPYVDRGQRPFLYVWLDNKCAASNDPSGSLVWDLGGPPDPGDLVIGGPAALIGNVKSNVIRLPILTLNSSVSS